MTGMRMPGFSSQSSSLFSGGRDGAIPPALAAIMRMGATPQQPQMEPAAFAARSVEGFNARRNFAAGGLVGGPPEGGMPMAPPPGQQMDAGALSAEAARVAQANPAVIQEIQSAIMQALQSGMLTMDQLNMAIQLATAAAQNPELYPRLRELAIQRGLADEDELPPQYDQGIIFAIMLAGQAVQQSQGGATPPAAPMGAPPQGAPQGAPQGNYAEGGHISQSRSPTKDESGVADDIPINVSGGEYVIPKHIVAAKGTEFFDRMIEQYDPDNSDGKANKA